MFSQGYAERSKQDGEKRNGRRKAEAIDRDRSNWQSPGTQKDRNTLSIHIAHSARLFVKIIVLDEPTAHLDPLTKRSIWKYIEGLRGERSILMATHSMDEAELISDRCDS